MTTSCNAHVLTATEAAGMMGCSVKTIEDRARAGDLPGLLWGDGGWVFPAEAFFARVNELAIAQAAKRREPKPAAAKTTPEPAKPPRRGAPPKLPTMNTAKS